jgi:hypothetical protein
MDLYKRIYKERQIIFQKIQTCNYSITQILICAFFAATCMISAMLIMGFTLDSSFLIQLAGATAFTCGFLFVFALWKTSKACGILDEDLKETLKNFKEMLDEVE